MNIGSQPEPFQKITTSKLLIFSILLGLPTVNSENESSILSFVHSPSLSTATGRSYTNKILDLGSFPNYATVMLMTEDRSWIKSEELLEILGKDSPNKGFSHFVVKPPSGYGMMVVIQELQIPAFNTFNQSLLIIDDNGRILECFSKFVFQIEGKSPVEVCGRTNDQLQYRRSVIDGVGPRSFVVPPGKSISVGFVYRDEEIDRSPFLSKQVPFYDMGYLFRASIAFTAYKVCPHGPPFYNENNEKLWPCDIPQSSREAVAACIAEDLFCDNIINCGMHDTKEFAVDEKFCTEKVTSSNDSDSVPLLPGTPRKNHIRVDILRLEEAIRNRIIDSSRPFGYNDMIIQMGTHSGKGSHFVPEPADKPDTLSHPAFVALIVLITIICVLIIGLIFRYCCKPCVGKGDPFGDSSNPEAVARFHENLRSRDNDPNATPGRTYGVTFDNLFKPVDDSPPSYSELFPQDVIESHNNHKVYSILTTSPVTSSNNEDSAEELSECPTPSVYSVPVSLVTPETSRSISASHANGNQQYFINPAFVHVEALPGNSGSASLGRRNDPVSVTINSDEDSLHHHRPSHAYSVDST